MQHRTQTSIRNLLVLQPEACRMNGRGGPDGLGTEPKWNGDSLIRFYRLGLRARFGADFARPRDIFQNSWMPRMQVEMRSGASAMNLSSSTALSRPAGSSASPLRTRNGSIMIPALRSLISG